MLATLPWFLANQPEDDLSVRSQALSSPFLVGTHKTAVAGYVAGQDGCELADADLTCVPFFVQGKPLPGKSAPEIVQTLGFLT